MNLEKAINHNGHNERDMRTMVSLAFEPGCL